jgi:ABC-2 type transport system permease protein
VNAIADTWTLAVRTLKHNIRSVDTIMTVLAMPLMLLLAFVFVLGGAMDTGPIRYVDFVVPVVLLYVITTGVAYTSFRVNEDVRSGMFTRLRTMPIARGALLGGHTAASVIVNAVSVALIGLFALLIGYRPVAGPAGWALTAGLLLLALVAFSLAGVAFGMVAKTVEGAGMIVYIMMGLLFVSSGFAPTHTMPIPLRVFAEHQPMTAIVNAIRDAQLALPDDGSALAATIWLAAIAAAGAVAALIANARPPARS